MLKGTLFTLGMVIFLLSITFVSAENQEIGPYQAGDTVTLIQSCGNCSYCNVTSLKYPNGTEALEDLSMTKDGVEFEYDYETSTEIIGTYIVNTDCDVDGISTPVSYDLIVTANGNSVPTAGVVVLFTFLFLIIIGGLISLLMYTLFHMIQWDFDARDLIYNVSLYLVTFAVYILSKEYLGNPFVNEMLVWVLGVGAITTIIFPIVAFVMSFIKGGFEQNRPSGY